MDGKRCIPPIWVGGSVDGRVEVGEAVGSSAEDGPGPRRRRWAGAGVDIRVSISEEHAVRDNAPPPAPAPAAQAEVEDTAAKGWQPPSRRLRSSPPPPVVDGPLRAEPKASSRQRPVRSRPPVSHDTGRLLLEAPKPAPKPPPLPMTRATSLWT